MAMTTPIFTNLMPAQKRFIKSSYTELYEIPMDSLVVGTMSQAQRWTWFPQKVLFPPPNPFRSAKNSY